MLRSVEDSCSRGSLEGAVVTRNALGGVIGESWLGSAATSGTFKPRIGLKKFPNLSRTILR